MTFEPDLICQPGPSSGIKMHSSPACFSNNSLPPFCPLTLQLPAPPYPVVPQAASNSTYSLRPPPSSQQHRYDPTSGNNAAARPTGSYSLDASAAIPRSSDPCVD